MLQWLIGGGVSAILKALSDAYEMKLKADNDHDKLVAEQNVKALEAELEARREVSRIRLETAGFWEMRLAVGIVGVATAAHYAAVVADSIFSFPWVVARLPSPMDEWEGAIVLSFFGLQAAVGLGGSIIRSLRR